MHKKDKDKDKATGTKGGQKRENTRQSRDTVAYACDGAGEISVSLPPTTQDSRTGGRARVAAAILSTNRRSNDHAALNYASTREPAPAPRAGAD